MVRIARLAASYRGGSHRDCCLAVHCGDWHVVAQSQFGWRGSEFRGGGFGGHRSAAAGLADGCDAGSAGPLGRLTGPACRCVVHLIGDTDGDAADQARQIRYQQVSGATAIATLERVWGRDLSGYDPDGPLPDVDPIRDAGITQGRVRHADRLVLTRRHRGLSQAEELSIRELVIALSARQQFVGTAAHIAEEIDRYVQTDAYDGFILVPHLTPYGLDQFVDRVVSIL